MVDAIGELLASIGQAAVSDDDLLNKKIDTKSPIIRVLYYLVPIAMLSGLYVWAAYY